MRGVGKEVPFCLESSLDAFDIRLSSHLEESGRAEEKNEKKV